MYTAIKFLIPPAMMCQSAFLMAAPVYLECNSEGSDFKNGKVTHLITLFEQTQSASITVKNTGYTRPQLETTFDADKVIISKPGEYESDEYLIDRRTLKITITTIGQSSTYVAGTGQCKIIQPAKRAF